MRERKRQKKCCFSHLNITTSALPTPAVQIQYMHYIIQIIALQKTLYICVTSKMLDDEIFILLEVQSTGSTKHRPTKRKLLQIIQTALSELASATVNYFMPMQVPVCGNPFGLLHQSCVWDGKCVIQPEGEDIWITFIIYEHI